MTATVKEQLIAVKELLSDPKRWAKGAYARVSKRGKGADPEAEEAQCWCLRGAIIKVSGAAWDVERAVVSCIPDNYYGWLPSFNDARTTKHADIMAVLDCAIEKASS